MVVGKRVHASNIRLRGSDPVTTTGDLTLNWAYAKCEACKSLYTARPQLLIL